MWWWRHPVVGQELKGVEAVIDKDFASENWQN